MSQKIRLIETINGQVSREIDLGTQTKWQAAGGNYTLKLESSGKAPEGMKVSRKGDSLLVADADGAQAELQGFFLAGQANTFTTDGSLTVEQAATSSVVNASTAPVQLAQAGEAQLLWSASSTAAGVEAASTPWLAWGGVGAGGVALANGIVHSAASASVAAPVNLVATGGIVAGPILAGNDLIVKLYRADGTTLINTATVDASGHYTADLHGYTGSLIAKVMSAGQGVADYRDEATGQTTDLSTVLLAVGVATSTGISLSINPLTTIAAQVAGLAADGSGALANEAAVTNANASVAAAFGLSGSLVSPAALVPVVSADGSVNAGADAYGKVLAVLSGLDQMNGGDMQASIHRLATDLQQGTLSAETKMMLVAAAEDPQVQAASSGIDAVIAGSVHLSTSEIQDVLQNSTAFTDSQLVGVLQSALGNQNISTDNLMDVKSAIISAGSGTSMTDLAAHVAEKTGISLPFGDALNNAESRGDVVLTLHGTSAHVGDAVTVSMSGMDMPTPYEWTLTVGTDANGNLTVTIPSSDSVYSNSWSVGQYNFDLTVDGASYSRSFLLDYENPANIYNGSVSYRSAFLTNSGVQGVDVQLPQNWIQGDQIQYSVDGGSHWTTVTSAPVNGVVSLSLADGTYSGLEIRGIDAVGNTSARIYNSSASFTIDQVAPTISVGSGTTVSLNEAGAVVLLNDQAIGNSDWHTNFMNIWGGASSNQVSYVQFAQAGTQSIPVQPSGNYLEYGTYHFYGVDLAGNVSRSDQTLTLVNQAPVLDANLAPQDQTPAAGTNWMLSLNPALFSDVEQITYQATLGNGDPLPGWMSFDANSLSFSGTPDSASIGQTYTIKLIASDGSLSSDVTFHLTAQDAHSDYTMTLVDNNPAVVTAVDASGQTLDSAQQALTQNVNFIMLSGNNNPVTDVVTVNLDGGDVTRDIDLRDFPTVNINVNAATAIEFMGVALDNSGPQTINIVANADLSILHPFDNNQGDQFSSNTVSALVMNVSGAGNVDLGQVSQSQGLILDAANLQGNLNVHVLGSTDNTLIGGHGNDTIGFGLGANTLTGGSGHDTFVLYKDINGASYQVGDVGANSVITDFVNGQDTLDLSYVVSKNLQVNTLQSALHDGDSFGANVGVSKYYDASAGGEYVYVDVNGDGVFNSGSDAQIFLQGVTGDISTASLHTANAVVGVTHTFTYQNDAWTVDSGNSDLAPTVWYGDSYYMGDNSLQDTASIVLDNAQGSATDGVLYLGNFESIDINVNSDTTLAKLSMYLDTYRMTNFGLDMMQQQINIHANANLTLSSPDWYQFDTADNAQQVTVTVDGSGNVDLGAVDGNWYNSFLDGAGNWRSQGITLDASAMTGSLRVAMTGSDNTIIGGSGNDYIVSGSYGHNTLTGNAGDDTFAYTSNSSALVDTITDFGVGADRLDIHAITTQGSTVDESLVAAMAENAAFANGSDTAIYYDGTNSYVYVDSNHDNVYNAGSDVAIKLVNYHMTAIDPALVHA